MLVGLATSEPRVTPITAAHGAKAVHFAHVARPVLEVFITAGCPVCRRAQRALGACEQVNALVDIVYRNIGGDMSNLPEGVVGGPTLVFRSRVVGLGTPDCGALAAQLRALLAGANETGKLP